MPCLYERVLKNMNKAKEIISHFISKSPESITDSTIMDHTAIPSSILQHRMYALLSDEGYILQDPGSVVTYHDFKLMLDNSNSKNRVLSKIKPKNNLFENLYNNIGDNFSIGIDIENISNFENLKKYDDQFYKNNFSLNEINYCKTRIDPKRSFTALFSLKESIIKADNSFKNIPFNQIEILHSRNGKPSFSGFSLSISHTDNLVITIAIRYNIQKKNEEVIQSKNFYTKKEVIYIASIIFILSLFVNLIAG